MTDPGQNLARKDSVRDLSTGDTATEMRNGTGNETKPKQPFQSSKGDSERN